MENVVEAIVLDTCKKCGKTFDVDCARSNANRDYCRDCAPAARAAAALEKRDNKDWIAVAREQGIPLWEQQPGESNDEYELWLVYRDLWPDQRPTVTRVGQAVGTPAATVSRAHQRWTWGARLQAWIREVTAERTAEMRRAKQKMVEDHIALGKVMREKMAIAVESLDPYDVTPSELVSLLKEMQRLETTSRDMLDDVERAVAADVDGYTPVDAPVGLFVDGGSDALALPGESPSGASMSQRDMLEVVDILAKSGYLKQVGVQQTVVVNVGDEL